VNNAIKFTSNGNIIIKSKQSQKYLNCIEISVNDKGVGIPEYIKA